MQGPWEAVTIISHADESTRHSQVNVRASINWRLRNDVGREIGGFVYLQRLPQSRHFRLFVEGVERSDGGNMEKRREALRLPIDRDWNIETRPLVSANAGKALLIRISFEDKDGGNNAQDDFKWVQLTMPLVSGNSRKAQAMIESIIFANTQRCA